MIRAWKSRDIQINVNVGAKNWAILPTRKAVLTRPQWRSVDSPHLLTKRSIWIETVWWKDVGQVPKNAGAWAPSRCCRIHPAGIVKDQLSARLLDLLNHSGMVNRAGHDHDNNFKKVGLRVTGRETVQEV